MRLRVTPHGDTTAFRNFRHAVFSLTTVTEGLVTLQSQSAIVASAVDAVAVDSKRVRLSPLASRPCNGQQARAPEPPEPAALVMLEGRGQQARAPERQPSFPCNIRRGGRGQQARAPERQPAALVMLEGRGGQSLCNGRVVPCNFRREGV